MKEMKRFLALLVIVAVGTVSLVVAFRLAPETWAVIAGILFGVVAALPMCVIVVLLLRQRPAVPPPAEVAPPAPQIIMLHPGAAADPRCGYVHPAQMQQLPPGMPSYPWPAPPSARTATQPFDWTADVEDVAAPSAPAPRPAPRPTYRILGQ